MALLTASPSRPSWSWNGCISIFSHISVKLLSFLHISSFPLCSSPPRLQLTGARAVPFFFLVPDIRHLPPVLPSWPPSLPHPSSPHLMPNGGIPPQPPHLTLLFCSGGAHLMQHDYISLATSAGVFWGLCNCSRNSITTLNMFPCRIYLQIRKKTLGVWSSLHEHQSLGVRACLSYCAF